MSDAPEPPSPDGNLEETAAAPIASGVAPAAILTPVSNAFGVPVGAFNVPGLPGFVPLTVHQQQQVQIWQGQFPPPDAIEHYERIMPGTFNRLVTMAEHAQEAQIQANSRALEATAADVRRGHILGFAVTFGAILGALWCAYIGSWQIGLALLAVPVMTVAQTLIASAKASPSAPSQPQDPAPQ